MTTFSVQVTGTDQDQDQDLVTDMGLDSATGMADHVQASDTVHVRVLVPGSAIILGKGWKK
ncbi:hypothetical protein GCM10008986_18010 [Salinibacillus aidingensis]|uniref:Uncharacterized protein n=1 Tax=Salinibacillus aidingensis TaxID=237684 RepID=A0ABP3L2Q4_9BACI